MRRFACSVYFHSQTSSACSSWFPYTPGSASHHTSSGSALFISAFGRRALTPMMKISQDNATPLLLIRDAYEAIILTAFFYLLLTYLSPDPEVQKAIFRKRGLSREADAECKRRGLPRRKWVFPLGFVRWKPQVGENSVTSFCAHVKHDECIVRMACSFCSS